MKFLSGALVFLKVFVIVVSECYSACPSNQSATSWDSDGMTQVLTLLTTTQLSLSVQQAVNSQLQDMVEKLNCQNKDSKEKINLALGKPTNQSSIYTDYRGPSPSYYAVDGKNCTYEHFGGAVTLRETSPWWIVDLLKPYLLGTVVLIPRTDRYWASQMSHIRIGVGNTFDGQNFNSSKFTECASVGTNNNEALRLECTNPIKGRYVAVYRLPGVAADWMTLCQVKVYESFDV